MQMRPINRSLAQVFSLILGPVLGTGLVVVSALAQGADSTTPSPKPKYGPGAVPLSLSHEYLRKSEAPDYWALSPYYLPQKTGSACSSASAAMLLNGLRSGKALGSEDPLVTEEGMLKKVGDSEWAARVGQGSGLLKSFKARGVTLEMLGSKLEKAIKAYGWDQARVEVVHMQDSSESSLKKLRSMLVENEKSASDLVLLNLDQGTLTGDSGGGHVSPLGAFDASTDRVLVMDVDREWYEPYWVKVEALARSMATKDRESGKNRGWVRVVR